ncbi:MAG: AraC family transcriptional regulator ligand-binding domain-containing protein [Salinisphaeraceae bacterium]|nr:AraC family transcriptional regulator ligand-binding domain-containing protein [Salinisphaeraceae bacterium]
MTKTSKQTSGLGPAIPAVYLLQTIEIVEKYGGTEAELLAHTQINPLLLRNTHARIQAEHAMMFALNVLRLYKGPGISFDFGLNLKFTAHGKLGYAVLSAATLGEAAEIAMQYVQSRFGSIQLEIEENDDGTTSAHISERFPLGPFQPILHEAILTLLWKHACLITGDDSLTCELHFPWPEPDYFAHFRDQLPTVYWSQPTSQMLIRTEYLSTPLKMADPLAASDALRELDREVAAIGVAPEHIVEQVRKHLIRTDTGFPSLEEVADRLHTSPRTLKRKLKLAHSSFRELLNDAILDESEKLLLNPDLDICQVSALLGYNDAPTFTNAYKRLTGQAPSEFRKRMTSPTEN